MTPSRFTVDPHILDNSDLSRVAELRHWQHMISVLLEQLERASVLLPSPPLASVYLDGTGNWSTPAGGGGGIAEAPTDGKQYTRQNAGWSVTAPDWTQVANKPTTFAPSTHAPTHLDNGTDPIPVATTTRTGSAPKLSGTATSFLNGTGVYSTPSGVTPAAHASTHITGGSDVIPAPTTSASGLVPVLPASGGATRFLDGTGAFNPVAYGNLTGVPASFTPSAHAVTHKSGGSDVIALDTLGATTDITTLNASTTAHGLLPKLSGNSAQFLNGNGAFSTPSVGAPPASLTDLGSPAGNSTIDTAQAFLIAVNLKWTTAANWTLTLNNVALGSQLFLRLLNNSGAARTFTILANTPTPTAYTVSVLVPGSAPLSGAITINNGNALNVNGVSYTVGGSPTIQLFGFGSTG